MLNVTILQRTNYCLLNSSIQGNRQVAGLGRTRQIQTGPGRGWCYLPSPLTVLHGILEQLWRPRNRRASSPLQRLPKPRPKMLTWDLQTHQTPTEGGHVPYSQATQSTRAKAGLVKIGQSLVHSALCFIEYGVHFSRCNHHPILQTGQLRL